MHLFLYNYCNHYKTFFGKTHQVGTFVNGLDHLESICHIYNCKVYILFFLSNLFYAVFSLSSFVMHIISLGSRITLELVWQELLFPLF